LQWLLLQLVVAVAVTVVVGEIDMARLFCYIQVQGDHSGPPREF